MNSNHYKSKLERTRTTLGGWKPTMAPGSIDVLVKYKTAMKSGYYESTSDRRALLRRVELPEWLTAEDCSESSLHNTIQKGRVKIPEEHTHMRQGHIFWSGRKFGFDGAAVGIDTSIRNHWVQHPSCQEIVFVVYRFGKLEAERWRISREQFLRYAKRVTPSKTFEPQYMVALSRLKVGGVSAPVSINTPFDILQNIELAVSSL